MKLIFVYKLNSDNANQTGIAKGCLAVNSEIHIASTLTAS